jgi:ABC-type proline/glycine betaine transport system ATPase subunit
MMSVKPLVGQPAVRPESAFKGALFRADWHLRFGESTTLKMINRLVEHDSGLIRFAGEEIRSLPVLELRRRMGYAIQSIGLFPHWTVAQNIATVPQLQNGRGQNR